MCQFSKKVLEKHHIQKILKYSLSKKLKFSSTQVTNYTVLPKLHAEVFFSHRQYWKIIKADGRKTTEHIQIPTVLP